MSETNISVAPIVGVSLFMSSTFSTFSVLWQEVVGLARNVAPVAGAAGQQNKLPPPHRSGDGDVREHIRSVSAVIQACWELLRAVRSGIKVDNLPITQHQGGRNVWLGAILPPSSTEQTTVLARKLEDVDVEKKSRVWAEKKGFASIKSNTWLILINGFQPFGGCILHWVSGDEKRITSVCETHILPYWTLIGLVGMIKPALIKVMPDCLQDCASYFL